MKEENKIPRFFLHDLVQVIIGSTILAIPVSFTQEVWEFSNELHLPNILGIFVVSIIFISIFTYYHYHRISVRKHWRTFAKRVVFTYIASFFVVCLLLILIDKAPFYTEPIVYIKRVIIITLPASMSAAIADTIK